MLYFELTRKDSGLVPTLELHGRLTTGSACQVFDEATQTLLVTGAQAVLLDCSRLDGVDSHGVRSLVRAVTHFEKNNGEVKFLRLTPRVLRVLDVMHLSDIFQTFDSEEQALASVKAHLGNEYPQTEKGKDRRRCPRTESTLVIQVENIMDGTSTLGRARNVSESGVYVVAQETFDPHTEVEVRLNLPPIPPGLPIEAKGVVVRNRPGVGMGIQFLLLAQDQRNAIARFVNSSIPGCAT